MKKINSFTYDVVPNERISISVTPTNFLNSQPDVEAVLDGKDFPNTGTQDAPLFEFTVSKKAGQTHRVLMEFIFFSDAPANSFYESEISSEGTNEGCPCGFIIARTSQIKEAGIRFRVKAA